MTVNELIENLKQFNPEDRVQIFDSEVGYIDITEIFQSDGHTKQVNIV